MRARSIHMSAAYHLAPSRVLTVTREGERLSAQETGRPKFEIMPRGVDAFASAMMISLFSCATVRPG